MMNSRFCASFSGRFSQRWHPKNLLAIGLLLTLLSMSVFLLSNERFTDNYFDVVGKLKGLGGGGGTPTAEKNAVELLVEQAKADFERVRSRQSKTLDEATNEYRRRYGKMPPKGFAAWYTFAVDNGVTRIDEYDDLMKWIEPFRKVPPKTLLGFIEGAYKGPGMSRWMIKNGTIVGIGNAQTDLDTSYGFPAFRGEGEWPKDIPEHDDVTPSETEENKETVAENSNEGKADDEGEKNKDTKEKTEEDPPKDEAKDVPNGDPEGATQQGGAKDEPKPETPDVPPTSKKGAVKKSWLEKEDISYFEKRDERPADDGIPQGKHPLDPFWHAYEIKKLLDPILVHLPDVQLLFNEWDEPRVLLDPAYDAKNPEFEQFQKKSYTNAYDDLVAKPCSTFNNFTEQYTNQKYPFAPYLSDLPESKEVCRHPNIGNNYGMVLSPNAFWVTRSLAPVLSMSRISSVGDLTYPNVLYIEGLWRGEYTDSKDSSWSSKESDLYWTGRTSGGLANPENNWHEYHRQRFVATVNGLVNTTLSAKFKENPELYKIRFPAVNQCVEEQCAEMTEYFHVDNKPDPFDEVYKHRFLLDIDGNIFSRRFYSLMFSRSTVLKQTWQQEYFDEWLWPWIHYVPVSMDFEELPDLMRFLANTKQGRRISQDIASEGREWAMQTFRAVEGSSYLFRLLIEYAELFEV